MNSNFQVRLVEGLIGQIYLLFSLQRIYCLWLVFLSAIMMLLRIFTFWLKLRTIQEDSLLDYFKEIKIMKEFLRKYSNHLVIKIESSWAQWLTTLEMQLLQEICLSSTSRNSKVTRDSFSNSKMNTAIKTVSYLRSKHR